MRKHGWQLPYHPLQVVAVAVFLALGFAFYVFFAPFVGRKMFQYIAMGIYTPLITCAFGLYIWCAAADPADPGVFRSKKYLEIPDGEKNSSQKNSNTYGESTSSIHDANASTIGGKSMDKETVVTEATSKDLGSEIDERKESSRPSSWCLQLALSPCMLFCKCCGSNEESSEQQMSEEGMFYCSLCKVEVFKYSKHCRVCDKCVDNFDHHCRWLNNCIGKRNYRKFFALMVSAVLLLILQWSTGIIVLTCCFLDRKRFSADIPSKLGSSFTLIPYVIVVALCTILAMAATLPLAQLFFFHILLIKKGISTYDYIIALREQEEELQGGGGQHSPQMSPASSITGLSSASSLSTFRRGAWCTPPRLFLEDQFDVVPPDTGSVSSYGKRSGRDEPIKKKTPAPVKISPWTLARLNAEEVSRAAAEARKRSKILQPVARQGASLGLHTDSFGSSRWMVPRPDNNRKRITKRVRLPADLPSLEPANNASSLATIKGFPTSSTSLAPLQLEARSAFQTSRAMSSLGGMMVAYSPESSIESPDIHPFGVSLSGADESRRLTGIPVTGSASEQGIPLSRSTSGGYEASGGEDSDRVPSRIIPRSTDWSNLLLHSEQDDGIARLKAAAAASSSSQANNRKF